MAVHVLPNPREQAAAPALTDHATETKLYLGFKSVYENVNLRDANSFLPGLDKDQRTELLGGARPFTNWWADKMEEKASASLLKTQASLSCPSLCVNTGIMSSSL